MKRLNILGLSLCIGAMTTGHAIDISMDAGDAIGNSSFNSGLNWAGGAAPTGGNNYFNATFLLRTPADGNSYSFLGDALTITGAGLGVAPNNEALMYKGSGVAGTITVNNLTINGGQLRHAQGDGDAFNLAGSLAVGANGMTVGLQGALNLSSSLSGSGTIRILDAGNNNVVRTMTLQSALNTFEGNIDLIAARSRLTLASGANLNFEIGANGINNQVFGIGVATFNGTFNFDLSGASSNIGDSWTIVAASVIEAYDDVTFTVNGFTQSGNAWRSGNYEFNEATGILSVVPEPSVGAILASGLAMFLARRRSRKA